MEDLLEELNAHGFAFDRDFVLKTCLTLLNQGARYEVEKFRKPNVREDIEAKWMRSRRQSAMFSISCVAKRIFSVTRRCRPIMFSFPWFICGIGSPTRGKPPEMSILTFSRFSGGSI